MASPLCPEDFSFPQLLLPTDQITYRGRSLSPNSTASSSTTTEYSMIGRKRQDANTPSSGHLTPQSGGSGVVLVKTFQCAEPPCQGGQLSCLDGLRSRSLEPTPFDETPFHRMTNVSQSALTPTLSKNGFRQRQAILDTESDYETPEKIWLRAQRLSAIRRTESANLNTPSPRGVSRSHSSVSRTHFYLDATPKASPMAHSEVTPKAQFGIRRRAPSMRVELRTPMCQRKRIQPAKEAEAVAENSTMAAIVCKQTGINFGPFTRVTSLHTLRPAETASKLVGRKTVYELEEPLMAGPSGLLQALKEVKFAEKEQLDRTPQADPRRITLFDLITEKERRHRVRSPPPVPPKPVRRLAAARAAAMVKSAQRSERSIENSVPKTVDDLKPSTLFQPTTPPSLPSPPRCAMLRKTTEKSGDVSGTAVVIPKRPSEEESRKESTPLLISDNPFVRWDRLKTLPSNKPHQDIPLPPQKPTMGDRPVPDTEGLTSLGSSGVGTEAFDDDGFITASASAITPLGTPVSSSSSSTNSVNSSFSPSIDWPHPEKITARPLSHQCSPDSFDETRLCPKPREVNGNSGEVGLIHDQSPIRVSLVAAPKKPLPISDGLPPETASDTTTTTTSSSRASTIFSYPWDLPPPQTHHPSSSSSPPPAVPLKWATLQRHLSEMGQPLLPPSPLTKTLKQNEYDPEDIPEKRSSVASEEAIEGPRSMVVQAGGEIGFANEIGDEKAYATIGDEPGAYEKVLEQQPAMEVPSPKLLQMSTAGSNEMIHKGPEQQYVYAEVRPSPDTSTSSSTGVRGPTVPIHPFKTNTTPLSPDAHFYEIIKGNLATSEAEKRSLEIQSPLNMLSNSTERLNPTNRNNGSPSSFSEPGKHLEQFICGLMNDRTSRFHKHMSTFIECIIQQLGQTPQKTLQNICQFINGVSNFLQKTHAAELQQAVEAEERELRGLQYFDVAQELENLLQLTVLRPLHRRLIEDLQYHGCGTVSPQTAEEFTELVKKEYQELPNLNQEDRQRLEKTLFQPVRRIFYQMQDAFQPGDKLDCLIRIFHTIDSQVPVPRNPIPGQSNDSRDIKKFTLYATIFALVDLLKPSRTLDIKGDSSASTGISRIEVQRLYLEALISPARLASSAEGCKCLTDLVCLLRYVEDFHCYASPAGAIRFLCRRNHQATEMEETIWHPGLNKMRRSYTDNIQEALDRSNDHSMSPSFASPPCQEGRVRKIGCIQGPEKSPTPYISSFILVLAANESERYLVPYEIPLRQSLTVRELCNMLALKLQIFDSKDYTLFYHSLSGDFPMSDTIHLERFMTQGLDANVQSVNEEMGISFSSSSSIDILATSKPTTQKISTFRRFFQRRKRLVSSGSLKSESPLSQHHHQKSNEAIKRQPSIDWSTMGGGDTNFVLVYRRRSSEAVLYAHDLFECLPSAGKPI
ncbi:hypothetical protein TcWFU_009053 [Taenia crassiceps]|uniref:Uncharacterized protein n=1 Tax=Taenia crassiceps TaxID=6207 RepID=A0ABR4Q723_9CEST